MGGVKFPERTVQVSFRIPESLYRHVQAVQKLLEMRAPIEGADPELVNTTFVGTYLLEEGVRATWAKEGARAGIPMEKTARRPYPGAPVSDDDWRRLTESLRKQAEEAEPSE